MHRTLLHLRRHINAPHQNQPRITLRKTILGIKPLKVYARRTDRERPEGEFTAELVDEGGEVDVEGEEVGEGEVVRGVVGGGEEEGGDGGAGEEPGVAGDV